MRLLILLMALASSASFAGQADFTVWIETQEEAGRLAVVPYVKASKPASLRYVLISHKEGGSGTSNTRQAGSINVIPAAPLALSRLLLGADAGDRYTIELRMYEDDRLVAEQTVTYPN